ncbi:MAG: nitroreductase family protein [Candidatus Omnitrophica bacterium]|nr:nitroreductase family protein [Candidatus Omnitrophota bacterium]
MEFFDCVCRRVSVRQYKDQEIDRELLERLVDAGRRAPTARAKEPWEFVAITDKGVLKKISCVAENGKFIENAAAAIVIFCAPTKYYLEDGCSATENILLAATDAGVGACWIAGDKKEYAKVIAVLLNAPAGLALVSIISLGVPKSIKDQVKKRSLEQVLHWENFL